MRARSAHLALSLAAALTACATGRGAGLLPPAAERVWPDPPLAPRARLVAEYPDARRGGGGHALWRRAFDAVVGADAGAAAPEAEVLVRPFALAAVRGDVVVADPDAARVLRLDWRSGRAEPLECAGRRWTSPIAVAEGAGGATLVADGDHVVRVTGSSCSDFGAGALTRPTGIAVASGRVYVVDPPRHDVVVFDDAGSELLRFGGRGEGEGELNYPTAVAAAPDGTLLVVDALNFRVVRFSADGRYLGTFGEAGEGEGAFARPKAVAVDAAGRIYVSDAERDVVAVFDAAGTFEYVLGSSGSGPGELLLPAGVAVAAAHLFVADSQNGRIQVFELLGDHS
jgi:6-bladed beta-propeller protein